MGTEMGITARWDMLIIGARCETCGEDLEPDEVIYGREIEPGRDFDWPRSDWPIPSHAHALHDATLHHYPKPRTSPYKADFCGRVLLATEPIREAAR